MAGVSLTALCPCALCLCIQPISHNQVAVAGGMSSKEAGYFLRVSARSGCVEVFNRATEIVIQNDKVHGDEHDSGHEFSNPSMVDFVSQIIQASCTLKFLEDCMGENSKVLIELHSCCTRMCHA